MSLHPRRRRRRAATGLVLLAALPYPGQAARAVDVQWTGPNDGNWNVGVNWSTSFVPDVSFNEAAAINNGATAVVDSLGFPPHPDVAGVKLGQAAAQIGGLRIANGGTLRSVAAATETGALTIGGSGRGNLTIFGGGMLTGASLSLGGSTFSSITLGGTSALTAKLQVGGAASLQRTTTIIGPNVDFSAAGGFMLGSSSTLAGEIRHASLHSPLTSTGTATLGGTFKPTFVGVTPALGNTWNVVDAGAINGAFALLDTSAAPALPAGQAYQLIQANGGANGRLLQLTVAPHLITADWNVNANGNWSLGSNWTGGSPPNGAGHTANFGPVISAPRVVTVNLPQTVGAINFDSPIGYTIAGPAALTMDAASGSVALINVTAGSHTLAAPVTLNDDVTVTVTPAASTLAVTGSLTATGRTITKAGAGAAQVRNVRAGGLTLSAGSVRVEPNGGPDGTSRTTNLNVSFGVRLDLTNNDFIVDYAAASPIATVRASIRSAYDTGDWTGDGIGTSMGNAAQFGLGYAESSAIFTSFPATFSGQQVDETSLLIAFTRFGDANLDGRVNLEDFNRLAANFGATSGAVWSQGDFTYDGIVNLNDFNRLAGNFGLSAGPDTPIEAGDWAALASAMPEPAAAAALLMGLPLASRQRRPRRGIAPTVSRAR